MSAISDARRQFRVAGSGGGLLARIFKRQARPPVPHGFAGTAEQFERLLKCGLVVWSAVVQANVLLLTSSGGDASANLVWSDDPAFDEVPDELTSIAQAVAQLKGADSQEPELGELARTVSDESNVISFPIPTQLAGGRRVLMTTAFINRSCLPGGVLSGPFLPLVIDPDNHQNSCVLPASFWPAPLAVQWREAARAAPRVKDVPEAQEMQWQRERLMAEARQAADHGELIRITPAAAAELHRLVGDAPCIVEVRCVAEGAGYRHVFNLIDGQSPCVVSCISEGVRIQIPDELSVILARGTEIDYVSSGRRRGFAFSNPNARSEY